ncbi:MAG: hypothetical protein ACRDNB_05295 [Gaiellaceae bacterium]
MGAICAVAVASASLLLQSWKPVTGLLTGAGAMITLATVYDLIPAPQVTVDGAVTCANEARVVGVYINSDGGRDDFAERTATSRPYVAHYRYRLNKGSRFKIGVGCGGSHNKWRDSISSDFVAADDQDFICYDGRDGEHPKTCTPVAG